MRGIFAFHTMRFAYWKLMVSVGKIEHQEYYKFILKQFKKAKREVNTGIIDHILKTAHLNTNYVQAIVNYLYSLEISPKSIP